MKENGDEVRVHLLDTPGYPDFLGHALPALAAVETAAIVINAQNGIEMMTGRFMQWAQKRGLDRIIIVNKIDADNVDCEQLLERIQQAFGKECLPLNLPAANRSKVSDCFFAPSGEADFSSVEEAHRQLIDQVVEVDEKLMESYLEKGEVTPEELHEPLERALREGHLIPVVFTSAQHRRRHAGAARRHRQATAQSDRGQSAGLHQSRPRAAAKRRRSHRSRIPASTRSRTSSRSRSIPTSGASRCSACTRAG